MHLRTKIAIMILIGMGILLLPFSGVFAKTQEVTINFMADSRQEFVRMMDLLPEFTKRTGIKVNMVQLQETPLRAKTGLELSAPSTEIDVIMLDFLFLPKYAKAGMLTPLDSYLAKFPTFKRADFMAPFLNALTYQGKLYGLPLYQDCNILMYRADLFAKYALHVPKTFDDFRSVAAKLAGIRKDFYGVSMRGQRGMGVNEWTWPTFLLIRGMTMGAIKG